MRHIPCLLLLFACGCAAMDDATRTELETVRSLIRSEPQEALRRLEAIVQAYPESMEVHACRAQAFAALGKHEQAAEEWAFIINARARKTSQQLLAAHLGFTREADQILGDTPHDVKNPPQGLLRDLIVKTQTSFSALLEENPDDRDAILGKARCLYRLGLYHRARPLVKELVAANPNDEGARYLLNLVREREVGIHERAIHEFCELVRSHDPDVRRQAASHLIYLMDSPKVKAEVKDNISGVLIRLARDRDRVTAEVTGWSKRYEGAESERIQGRQIARQLREVDTAQALNDWERAWHVLTEMPARDPRVERRRAEFVRAWSQELVAKGRLRLENGELDEANAIEKHLQALPTDVLPAEILRGRREFLDALAHHRTEMVAKDKLEGVQEALTKGELDEALRQLDALEGTGGAAVQREIDLARAQVLARKGDTREALRILDRAGNVTKPQLRRLYGILLSGEGRSEEAVTVLGSLPFNLLHSDALEALLSALEREGSWEAILGHLLGLRPLPDHFQPLYRRACEHAARSKLRANDIKGALLLLRSYATPAELTEGGLRNVYLEGLLRAGELDEAVVVLLEKDEGPSSLDPETLKLAEQVLESRLAQGQRFQVLLRMRGNTPEVEPKLMELWPRYGDYLPSPANYNVSFRSYSVNEQGMAGEPAYHLLRMEWTEECFLVTEKDAPDQRWWSEDGVWFRKTELGVMEIPVRAGDDTPSHRSYTLGKTDWVAEIVEAPTRVKIEEKSYAGCLRVRLVPNGETEESIYIDLAPELGEIRREVYRNGHLQFVRELVRITPI